MSRHTSTFGSESASQKKSPSIRTASFPKLLFSDSYVVYSHALCICLHRKWAKSSEYTDDSLCCYEASYSATAFYEAMTALGAMEIS